MWMIWMLHCFKITASIEDRLLINAREVWFQKVTSVSSAATAMISLCLDAWCEGKMFRRVSLQFHWLCPENSTHGIAYWKLPLQSVAISGIEVV